MKYAPVTRNFHELQAAQHAAQSASSSIVLMRFRVVTKPDQGHALNAAQRSVQVYVPQHRHRAAAGFALLLQLIELAAIFHHG